MAKVVQVAFSDDEYTQLLEEKKKANAEGYTDAQYIKSTILPDDDFDKWFPELLRRVDAMKTGTKFNIRAVMATDWVDIPKVIRLRLGRVFYNHVVAGKVEFVRDTVKGNDKTQWYQKGDMENES
jgi:hypothetical protein